MQRCFVQDWPSDATHTRHKLSQAHLQSQTRTRVHTHVNPRAYTHADLTHKHMSTHVVMGTCHKHTWGRMSMYMLTDMCIHIHTHAHMGTYAHVHTRVHTYSQISSTQPHTRTQAQSPQLQPQTLRSEHTHTPHSHSAQFQGILTPQSTSKLDFTLTIQGHTRN